MWDNEIPPVDNKKIMHRNFDSRILRVVVANKEEIEINYFKE